MTKEYCILNLVVSASVIFNVIYKKNKMKSLVVLWALLFLVIRYLRGLPRQYF